MAQGYMRQLRAHSGQCGAGEKAVFFPVENMWMNRCNPALWKSLLRAKRIFWVVFGRYSAISRFVCGVYGGIRSPRRGLALVGLACAEHSR